MIIKRSVLASAAAALLGLGAAGQASADVYAASALSIDNLNILFLQGATSAAQNVSINNFNFTLQNTAVLNSVGTLTTATCGGTIASNSCSTTAPTLDALAANAPASSITRTNNQVSGDGSFTVFGIGAGTNWSNSDSVIRTSELTSAGANPTVTDQIAESKITSATSASAASLIQSITGFTLFFSVNGPNPVDMDVSFLADPDMFAQILNELGVSGAQANMAVSLTLQKDGTGGIGQPALAGVSWAPNGDTTQNNCLTTTGITCVENADTESLNLVIGTTTNNTSASHSWGPNAEGSVAYDIFAQGLTAGNWTLTLRAETSTQLSRTDVPEPGTLALLGLGLAGLGAMRRRRG